MDRTGYAVRRSRHNVLHSGAGSGHGNRREDNGGNNRKSRSRSLVFGAAVPAVLLLYVLGMRGLVHLSLRQLVTPGTRDTGFNATSARFLFRTCLTRSVTPHLLEGYK
ncbi:hypothetical protein GDO81_025559 [Engystomops pustulosus]|uniref:Uncharacterized protein n=1 Tax=Engystomops pustulosus TaxID=76066 RepID=A0AAV6YJK6_ENGPU|nr:hypothetical protein GDO81_025559 [Engystomops pustulosus]